jgi:hypothetical protein
MTANLHNKWLKKHIEAILIPALQDMGFEWHKQGTAKEVGREIVLGLPWGSMRRRNEKAMDIVEIGLRKRDRSFFALGVGSCPLGGARDYLKGKHYSAYDIMVSSLEEYWKMNNYPILQSHFGIRFKALRHASETDYEKLIRRVVSYLPEIEDALAAGKRGPHMRFVRNPRMYE